MNHAWFCSVAAWTLVLSGLAIGPRPVEALDDPPPHRLADTARTDPGPPLWLSLEAATEEDSLVEGLFAESLPLIRAAADSWRGGPRQGREPCLTMDRPSEPFLPAGNLLELATGSEEILILRVGAERVGFFQGQPGTLYRVRELERLKGAASSVGVGERFLFYPSASFRIAGVEVCQESRRGPERPGTGSRVFLFVDRSWQTEAGRAYSPADAQIFFEEPTGEVSVPSSFGLSELDRAALRFEQLVEAAVQVIDRGGSS